MKTILFICFLFLAYSLEAGKDSELTLRGYVSPVSYIEVRPYSSLVSLSLSKGGTYPIAGFFGHSNSPQQELVFSVQSQNGGLKYAHGTETIPYTLSLNHTKLPLDGSTFVLKETGVLNKWLELSLSYRIPLTKSLLRGRYEDILVFETQAGETISVLEIKGDL